MTNMKRTRGRPKGSGKNDAQTLASVADLLLKHPQLKASAAMRQVIGGRDDWGATPETLLRRLQGKWSIEKTTLMEAARERAARVDVTPRSAAVGESWPAMSVIERMQRFAQSPVGRAAQGYIQSPAYQKLQLWMNSPSYAAQMSVVEKLARGMIDDSLQKRFLEMQKFAGSLPGLGKWGRGFV
jgi:hypothetical protein